MCYVAISITWGGSVRVGAGGREGDFLVLICAKSLHVPETTVLLSFAVMWHSNCCAVDGGGTRVRICDCSFFSLFQKQWLFCSMFKMLLNLCEKLGGSRIRLNAGGSFVAFETPDHCFASAIMEIGVIDVQNVIKCLEYWRSVSNFGISEIVSKWVVARSQFRSYLFLVFCRWAAVTLPNRIAQSRKTVPGTVKQSNKFRRKY